MKTVKEIIEEENITSVAELFTKHPERWKQGKDNSSGFYDEEGNETDSDDATRCCLLGAVNIVGSVTETYADTNLARKILGVYVSVWNDAEGRTVEEVIELAKKAKL